VVSLGWGAGQPGVMFVSHPAPPFCIVLHLLEALCAKVDLCLG
jgi:hypothetical protein